jgi:5'-nucleotidase
VQIWGRCDVFRDGSAALEGTLFGIPLCPSPKGGTQSFTFKTAAYYAWRIAQTVLAHGLPEETFLNINIRGRRRASITGVHMTSLSRRRFDSSVPEKIDPCGRKYYWIAGTRVSWERHVPSDFEAVRQCQVFITPIHSDLTHCQALEQLRSWDLLNKTGPRRRRFEHGALQRAVLEDTLRVRRPTRLLHGKMSITRRTRQRQLIHRP